ncbi:glycosyltransferase family 1 protein [Phyllobacterium salinisoli]|uniref:Glycosyltransferase family 1 protein n=1 Tax=Phyllobacterium salinisoli TaxID=1899321 RepID=A0A368JZS0_9HYPH|nr:glycosyltransferase family 4 protein [Phyllobacterium salinisoli]RCS22627.1 glycosyltransferase family 1 protein [Phyllobacterium salinisoli]
MRIAFHAPMKSPTHPVPSGDRRMAQLLVKALERSGHEVELVSELSTHQREPDLARFATIERAAAGEAARLRALWKCEGAPDLWFTYHPYYKAPDMIGPGLAAAFGIPYLTAEASYSARRNAGLWAKTQAVTLQSVKQAALNICFTRRDRDGLLAAVPDAALDMLLPFIDTAAYPERSPAVDPSRLVCIAMMRSGDKYASYEMLARALDKLRHLPWTLSVVGDGALRREVMALFAGLPPQRIEWRLRLEAPEVTSVLSGAGIYVWPGCGEAYGLAYLEAQAVGLPVVAQHVAGVPEVVVNGQTGLLTPPGDVEAFASAIERLLGNERERMMMADAAWRFVHEERSLEVAAVRLAAMLAKVAGA